MASPSRAHIVNNFDRGLGGLFTDARKLDDVGRCAFTGARSGSHRGRRNARPAVLFDQRSDQGALAGEGGCLGVGRGTRLHGRRRRDKTGRMPASEKSLSREFKTIAFVSTDAFDSLARGARRRFFEQEKRGAILRRLIREFLPQPARNRHAFQRVTLTWHRRGKSGFEPRKFAAKPLGAFQPALVGHDGSEPADRWDASKSVRMNTTLAASVAVPFRPSGREFIGSLPMPQSGIFGANILLRGCAGEARYARLLRESGGVFPRRRQVFIIPWQLLTTIHSRLNYWRRS
jgi:hypothetical protein